MGIQHATDDTFEQLVLKNDKPTVVDFWATWCGPCKMVAPEREKIAAKYEGAVDRSVVEGRRLERDPLGPPDGRLRVGRPKSRPGDHRVEKELGPLTRQRGKRRRAGREGQDAVLIGPPDRGQLFGRGDQDVPH